MDLLLGKGGHYLILRYRDYDSRHLALRAWYGERSAADRIQANQLPQKPGQFR